MILYLDTSALVKRYFREPHTEEIISLWQKADEVITSSVAYAEAMATFYRKKRETGIHVDEIQAIINDFSEDWNCFIRIRADDELNRYINQVTARYPLRGFDAIHLSSALIVFPKFEKELLFCCFDKQLVDAAEKEGLWIFQG